MIKILVVDDQRIFTPREGAEITHTTTSQAGIDALAVAGPWDEIWLDHDLGMESEGSGYDMVQELVMAFEDGDLEPDEVLALHDGRIYVHSMNPAGADRMVAALTRYFPVARIDPTPYLDFDAMYAENRNPYLAGPRR